MFGLRIRNAYLRIFMVLTTEGYLLPSRLLPQLTYWELMWSRVILSLRVNVARVALNRTAIFEEVA